MKVLKNILNNKGLSLVETIIYISIMSIIATSIISIVVQLVNIKLKADSQSIISDEATNIFEELINATRNGDTFSVIDTDILWVTTGGETVEYTVSSGSLTKEQGVDNFQISSNLVTVESFTLIDWTTTSSDSLLVIQFNLRRGSENESFQTSVQCR